MTHQEIYNTIKENGAGMYTIIRTDGKTDNVRLFIRNIMDDVYQFYKGSRNRGYKIDTEDIISIEPFKKVKDQTKQARRFLTKCVSYLSASGLWVDMLNDFARLLALDDERLMEYINSQDFDHWEKACELNKKYGISRRWVDNLKRTIERGVKGIKTDKDTTDEIESSIVRRVEGSWFWRMNFDNRFTLHKDKKDGLCANYSEEYKNCGNGHYYFALDSKHAIFCEDD